jgi:hypothetical protein
MAKAKTLDCVVVAGYPEGADLKDPASPEAFSSLVIVNKGEFMANYRTPFIRSTNEERAEREEGFFSEEIKELGNVAIGIGKCPTKSCTRITNLTSSVIGTDLK